MNNPALYVKESLLAKRNADYVLSKNLDVLQTEGVCSVLDVGCGPGNITYEQLLPILPKTTKKIIGVDLSPEHVEYAKKHYRADARVSYQQMDIQTDGIPEELVSAFDLITSLYCLHFVRNQKKALANIYTMLKPGGKVLISFLRKSPLRKLYYDVYSHPKWTEYMRNIDEIIPLENSVQHYVKLFEEIGFAGCRFEDYENVSVHSKENTLGIISALNSFEVPNDLQRSFIEDHGKIYSQSGYSRTDSNGEEVFDFPNTTLIISAFKN